MELEKHIEILLLDNDCVIVPGLGGFIAYHTDARYDAESASFLPPTRVAGFNPKLSMNDSLLAQSYVETYDISYPEAVKRIASESEALKESLEHNGYHEIPGVGTLRVNNEGGYNFEPYEAGLLTPEYYGLGCFEALSLIRPVAESDNDVTDEAEENEKGKYIRIRVSTLRNIAAAAVAIFAFFLISSPLGNHETNMASVASLQSSVFNNILPLSSSEKENKAENIADAVKPVARPAVKKDSTVVLAVTKANAHEAKAEVKAEVKKAEVPKANSYYSIVLASALSKHNATQFAEKLTEQGLKDIHPVECSNGMKVVCGKFENENDAYSALRGLRGNENFKDAWIYKVRVKK